MLVCSTIQYFDESFNGAKVIFRWLYRESVHFFLQNTLLQLESLPTVFHDQGERMFYCTLWVNEKKSKTIWFHTNDSRRFLPTPQFIHSQLLHHRYDQNYYSSINSATAYFLVSLLAASIARANVLVSASSCKQDANEGISQAAHTKTELLLPLSAGFSLEYCRTLILQHLISICDYCFLVGIFYVQETQQLERYWNSLLSSHKKSWHFFRTTIIWWTDWWPI